MKLSKIARKFDNLLVADAYNPLSTFKGQLLDSSPTLRDALTNERRTLSLDPNLNIFSRRTVIFNSSVWMCGVEAVDYYQGNPIRKEILLTMADGLASVVSTTQALSSLPGNSVYASRIWIKTISEIETNSNTPNRYDIYFAKGETLEIGSFIYLNNTWHIIRSTHDTPSGYNVAVTEEMPRQLVVDVEYGSKVYNPITDSYGASAGGGIVRAIPLRWQTHYYYTQEATEKFNLGDIVLQVSKTSVPNPAVGHEITIPKLAIGFSTRTTNVIFRVVHILDQQDYWSLHLSHD